MTGFCPVSPSSLKARAIERGTTEVCGPLTVTPEGMYTLKGRKATLNEAIIALGRHWKSLAA